MNVDELLPKLYTEYRIARDPERRAITAWSSGAIAAFTVAWERPGQFRTKVLSGIGTYVNLAGGHVYPDKIIGERAQADSHRAIVQDRKVRCACRGSAARSESGPGTLTYRGRIRDTWVTVHPIVEARALSFSSF